MKMLVRLMYFIVYSKKKRRRRKRNKKNLDSSDGERESRNKRGRKNIRKVIKVKDLELETKLAAKEEIQRKRRLEERRKKVEQTLRHWFDSFSFEYLFIDSSILKYTIRNWRKSRSWKNWYWISMKRAKSN